MDPDVLMIGGFLRISAKSWKAGRWRNPSNPVFFSPSWRKRRTSRKNMRSQTLDKEKDQISRDKTAMVLLILEGFNQLTTIC